MARLDTRIFRDRHFAATPRLMNDALRSLCCSLSSAEPIYVPCVPEGAPGECFFNVRSKVERDAGEILFGWTLWEWRNVFIEAEHHAVWKSKDRLVDVTPHVPVAEERILFLPDPGRVYDFENVRRTPNVKRSLGVLSEVQAWLDATDRLDAFITAHSAGREVTVPAYEYRCLQDHVVQTRAAVVLALSRITGPKEPCICRSGRQFRRCCSHYIGH